MAHHNRLHYVRFAAFKLATTASSRCYSTFSLLFLLVLFLFLLVSLIIEDNHTNLVSDVEIVFKAARDSSLVDGNGLKTYLRGFLSVSDRPKLGQRKTCEYSFTIYHIACLVLKSHR